MSRFLNKRLKGVTPYVPGEQPKDGRIIKLNTNESPFGPSPQVAKRLKEMKGFHRYPDPSTQKATQAISRYYGLDPEQLLLGNGSDELLSFSFYAYGTKMIFPQITYGFYPVVARAFGEHFREIPLEKDLSINPKTYYNAGATVVLANPNAPTGLALKKKEIQGILENNRNNMVIVDEAYVDFGAESVVPLVGKYENLLVIQTFSKSRGLASMRIGLAMAQREIIDDLKRIKYSFNPYSVSGEALAAVEASLEDRLYFEKTTGEVAETRTWFSHEMRRLGHRVVESRANFVLVTGGKAYQEYLWSRGIMVRHFDKKPIADYVRITIGTREEMKKVVEVTEERYA